MINKLIIDGSKVELSESTKMPFTYTFSEPGVHNVKIGLDNTDEICAYAFKNCSELTKVNIPTAIAKIKKNAFENCSSLESIDIPSQVKYIGPNVFDGCTSLKEINFEANTPPTFYSTLSSTTNCYIPNDSKFEVANELVKDGSIQYYTKNNLGYYQEVSVDELDDDTQYYYDKWTSVHNHYNILENKFKVRVSSMSFVDNDGTDTTRFGNVITGDTVQLFGYRLYPTDATNDKVIWLSNNTSLGTITENGVLSTNFGKIGTMNITLCAEPDYTGSYAFARLSVSVVKDQSLLAFNTNEAIITSLDELNVPTLTYKDDLFTWKEIYPNDNPTITYSSDNEEIARVDENGNITVIDNGKTIIRAKLTNSLRFADAEATYDLTVNIEGLSKIIPIIKFVSNGEQVDAQNGIEITDINNFELPTLDLDGIDNLQTSYSIESGDCVAINEHTGQLTILKSHGEAIIKVTTEETNEYKETWASYKVVVNLALDIIEEFAFGTLFENAITEYTFAITDQQLPFVMTDVELHNVPEDLDVQVVYTSTNMDIVEVDPATGQITIKAENGRVEIEATIKDSLKYNDISVSFILNVVNQQSDSENGSQDGSYESF